MGFPVYECPASLPDRIPALLRAQGMSVRPTQIQRREDLPQRRPDDFGYDVDRGLVGASVYGGKQQGKTYFHITWRRVWCMIFPWLSWRLNAEIRSVLSDQGAKDMDLDELK